MKRILYLLPENYILHIFITILKKHCFKQYLSVVCWSQIGGGSSPSFFILIDICGTTTPTQHDWTTWRNIENWSKYTNYENQSCEELRFRLRFSAIFQWEFAGFRGINIYFRLPISIISSDIPFPSAVFRILFKFSQRNRFHLNTNLNEKFVMMSKFVIRDIFGLLGYLWVIFVLSFVFSSNLLYRFPLPEGFGFCMPISIFWSSGKNPLCHCRRNFSFPHSAFRCPK